MELRVIGKVCSSISRRSQMPPFGAPASIEVLPEFRDGLLRLEKHTHIWVLAWFDRGERDLLQVTPRGVKDRGPESLHGVFAVRSPARPNPIGLTVARVLGIDGLTIQVDRLDFLDGTPVLDIKPYFVTRDLIFSATNAPIGLPSDRAALRESLRQQAWRFHGEDCAGLAMAVRILEHYRSEFLGLGEPPRWSLSVPPDRGCLVDAIMGMTRASLGRGALRFHAGNSVRIQDREYELLDVDPASIWEAADSALFRVWQTG